MIGTVLALAALAYVLWPLIAADGRSGQRGRPRGSPLPEGDAVTVPPAPLPEAEDPVEAEIRRARAQLRVCPACGPRPEPDARYCSSCGAALA
jgi:hypothetical protein